MVVTINYRLSTLGFMAIPGTNITGNFGIADQIVALQVCILSFIKEMFFAADVKVLLVDGRKHRAIWWRSQQNHHHR